MKYYTDYDFDNEIDTVKTNKKIEYLNIPCSFDIETTSTYTANGDKLAFMYIWGFGIKNKDYTYYGRSWEEFNNLCKMLKTKYDLSSKKRLVVYVHNLAYEFQFMYPHINFTDIFATDERKPLKALTEYGIEFRDSLILSGYSLQKTAENLIKYPVKKMIGDLDYSLTRHTETPLTEKEMKYLENDIIIILNYIMEQIEYEGNITLIPTTNTGRVRRYVKTKCYGKNSGKNDLGKWKKYYKLMQYMTINPLQYGQVRKAFQGGFTHSNSFYTGQTIQNVTSIDFTSSYPAVMLTEKFPMGRAIRVDDSITPAEFEDLQNRFCLLFKIKVTGIKSAFIYENYISENKCEKLKNPVINNGRINSADYLETTITDVDFDIIKKCYDWDNLEITQIVKYAKGYLPKAIIQSVLDLYQDKTKLKGVKGKETEYLLSKGMLNSIYGMTVTNVINEDVEFENGNWEVKPNQKVFEKIEKYNKSKQRFLFYPWGVWITAYSRKNLWTGIFAINEDYIYSDTDSIKLKNYKKHLPYINAYNNLVMKKLELMAEHHKIDKSLFSPQGKTIGIWDYEGTYDNFKTLGAKRYLSEKDGKFEITIAGLSKRAGIKYILEKTGGKSRDVFDFFNNKMYIPADDTGKLTHTYIDTPITEPIIDYLGKEKEITALSGVHLEKVDFTLSQSQEYISFLKDLKSGYLYKGDLMK